MKSFPSNVPYIAIAEAYFQKSCLPDEVVHHIDGNRENNDAENLVIMKRSQHSRLHSGLMGALDQWKKKVARPLCNTCLYVSVFQLMNIATRENIGDDLSAFLVGIWIHAKAKPISRDMDAREILTSLYDHGIEWKQQHDHDCYSGKNMIIVKKVLTK